ncbi:MAG: DUF4296 domain-containing protein [Chitinophagaceae bacterium]|nr:DUF4296 domain-containing protein [Chitinophagaceae bacterium]
MKYIIGTILCAFFFQKCIPNKEDEEQIIPEEKMVSIFVEIYILETLIDEMKLTEEQQKQVYQEKELKILKKYKTDTKIYNRSYKYYLEHQDKLKNIYTHLLDSLNLYRNASSKRSILE